jgi:hypothetical protein
MSKICCFSSKICSGSVAIDEGGFVADESVAGRIEEVPLVVFIDKLCVVVVDIIMNLVLIRLIYCAPRGQHAMQRVVVVLRRTGGKNR